MRFTANDFLHQACRWGYEHQTTMIDDDEFLPIVKKVGMSDRDIERLKEELERDGKIANLRGIGGMRDFEISPNQFLQYVRKALPATTLANAQALYNSNASGNFRSSTFVEQLGVSEKDASYLFELVRAHKRT